MITIKVTLKAVKDSSYYCSLDNIVYFKGGFLSLSVALTSAPFHKEPFQKGFALPHYLFQLHRGQAGTGSDVGLQ